MSERYRGREPKPPRLLEGQKLVMLNGRPVIKTPLPGGRGEHFLHLGAVERIRRKWFSG
jgi:hypothetical protein